MIESKFGVLRKFAAVGAIVQKWVGTFDVWVEVI